MLYYWVHKIYSIHLQFTGTDCNLLFNKKIITRISTDSRYNINSFNYKYVENRLSCTKESPSLITTNASMKIVSKQVFQKDTKFH